MTKPITSVGFMMLVEDGKVAVDTPVAEVLPEFKDIGVYTGGGAGVPFLTRPTAEPMRMLDLLRHTSGLTYGFQNRSNIDAAYRMTKSNAGPVENWHGEHDLNGFIGDPGQDSAGVLAGRGLELLGLDRRPGRGDRTRVGPAAGPLSRGEDLHAAEDARHRLRRAGGQGRPAARLLRLGRSVGGTGDATTQGEESVWLLPAQGALRLLRAAAAWSRPPWIITASA